MTGFRDTFIANATLAKNVSSVYTYMYLYLTVGIWDTSALTTISWDVPDTVLYEKDPWKGAMHTSDLYFLFQGMSFR